MACFICFHKGHLIKDTIILAINVRENTTSVFALNLKNQMIEIIQGHQIIVIRQT